MNADASTSAAKSNSSWKSHLLSGFDPICLSEMGYAELLRRTDTKYILSELQLVQALSGLTDHYRILEIEGRRLHRYETLYFDTTDLALYFQHHNGRRNRYKVRERSYADSGQAFLEVKHKVNGSTTIKSRLQTYKMSPELSPDVEPFLRACYPYQAEELEARLLNTFQRITLVSKHCVERLTIDVNLAFSWDGVRVPLDGVAVAEVKQDGFSLDSEFVQQMRALGARPAGLSKYCIGISMLYPAVKHNQFEPTLRLIDKTMGGHHHVQ